MRPLPAASGVPPTNDVFIRALVMARLEAHRWFAPGRLWLPANWRASLATAVWVVNWVHHRATHMRTAAQIARAPSLAQANILVIKVAHLPDGRHAVQMNEPLLTGGHTHLGVVTLFRHQLRRHARAPHKLAAAPNV